MYNSLNRIKNIKKLYNAGKLMKDQNKKFAFSQPTDRTPSHALDYQIALFNKNNKFKEPINNVIEYVAVLNENRQIIFANSQFISLANTIQQNCTITGLRTGEALNCFYALSSEAGCGSSENCRVCGAFKAILSAQKGRPDQETCHILKADGGAWDLRIWTHPFEYEGLKFTFFAALDISHESRRKVLERVFFHDLKNTAGGIQGFTKMLANDRFNTEQKKEFQEILQRLSFQLLDEIESQQQLLSAEDNLLKIDIVSINPKTFLSELKDNFKLLPITENKIIKIELNGTVDTIQTDKVLLYRVLANMLKNALEAINKNDNVTIRYSSKNNDTITIEVNNPGFMTDDVKLQVFQRSFSTKGRGRGLGTYSIRLFTEVYLKGKAGFSSNKESGTTFYITIPRDLNSKKFNEHY